MKNISLLLLFITFFSITLNAKEIVTENATVRLVANSEDDFKQGKIAVHYKLRPLWHIYWQNPGDSGAAPKFQIGKTHIQASAWPAPKRIPVSHLVNFGYEDEVLIFLNLPTPFIGKSIELEWLVCKVDCIPGFGNIQLNQQNVAIAPALVQKFKNKIPKKIDQKVLINQETPDFIDVDIPGVNLTTAKELHVFPVDGANYSSQSSEIINKNNKNIVRIFKTKNSTKNNAAPWFTALVKNKQGQLEAFDFTVEPKNDFSQYLWALLLALMGGLILNLMPCVFPVLFLKAYSFIKADDPRAIVKSSLHYSAGVMFSFFVLGLSVVAFQASGKALGWGFQMQSPLFIGFLIFLFFAMSMSFLDILNLNSLSAPQVLGPLGNSDFGTGVLAVIVASPCTAPFMGTALGLTLSLPSLQSLSIFLALGLGLALPVPLLALWPGLAAKLPKSGPWMVTLKKLMAIPLLITCVWLSWVLYSQLNVSKNMGAWNSYDKATIAEQIKTRPVFIDFTATWCITCQVNKQTVLETRKIQALFKSKNVYLVRADWTNYDPEITKALAAFNRNSIPLYVYYNKGDDREILLPEILTKDIMHKVINKGDSP